MNEETTDKHALFTQTITRFSKLNVAGRHYFIGRLIGSANDKPVLRLEIERVFQRLDTDPHLAKCWKAAAAVAEEAQPVPETAA